MTNKNQKSTLAKLLATENLTVVHSASAKTASFDVRSRLLTLPVFKDMSSDVYDLFVGHEVGHALWTEENDVISAMEGKPAQFHSFLNVVEDVRIEKFIKSHYPGIKRNFVRGYTELFESGFFGVSEDELGDLNLLDRLNVYFKMLGNYAVDIPFAEDEKPFIQKMKNLETFEDVVAVATELFEKAIQEHQNKDEQKEAEVTDGDGDEMGESVQSEMPEGGDETEDSDDETAAGAGDETEDGDQTEDSAEQTGLGSGDETEDADQSNSGMNGANDGHTYNPNLNSITDNSLKDAFVNEETFNTDSKAKRENFVPISNFKINLDNIIVDSDEVFKQYSSYNYVRGNYNVSVAEFENEILKIASEFTKENSSTVGYLAKQFEMNKAASSYKRTTQNRTGVIDTNKLHSFKFNDEIFLSSTYTPDDKNHAFVAFVDWSGSMSSDIVETVEQLATVALFCRKVGIPFVAYAFTNSRLTEFNAIEFDVDAEVRVEAFSLLEFFSLNSSNKKFKRELGAALSISRSARSFTSVQGDMSYLSLSGTPLNITAFVAPEIIKMVRSKTGAEKMTTMFLTDGYDGNGILFPDTHYYKFGYLTNPKTRKPVDTNDTFDLYGYIKATTGSKVVVLHITDSPNVPKKYAKKYNYVLGQYEVNEKLLNYAFVTKMNKRFKKEGYQIFTDNGYDSAYILRGKNLRIDNSSHLDELEENATARKIATAFKKGRNSKLATRPMLNHFIETMA